MKPLHNQRDLDAEPDCPPPAREDFPESAIHFVWTPLDNPKNFKTALEKNPRRRLTGRNRCLSNGLSMFESVEQARAKFDKLRRSNPNIGKQIGDHVAHLKLDTSDGHATHSNPEGHFTFFRIATLALASKTDDCTPIR